MSAPSLGVLLDLVEQDGRMRSYLEHNVRNFRCVLGGLAMAKAHRMEFDPRADYWYHPGRRAAVWYLSTQWHGCFAPAKAMRKLARAVCEALDGVTETYEGVEGYEARWGLLVEEMIDVLPASLEISAVGRLSPWWSAPGEQGLRAHLVAFLRSTVAADGTLASGEPGFLRRVPWWPYVDPSEGLRQRRAFFYAFAHLMTSTNAYRVAGAQSFASVLQNTPVGAVLDTLEAWVDRGEAVFPSMSSQDEVARDRSAHTSVQELLGLLTLQRGPFLNNTNLDDMAELHRRLRGSEGSNPYEMREELGRLLGDLIRKEKLVAPLNRLFETLTEVPLEPTLNFETCRRKRVQAKVGESFEDLADAALCDELADHAAQVVSMWTVEARASACAHLLLDAAMVSGAWRRGPSAPEVPGETLPVGLRESARLALSYLHAGQHVVLAGAPGTGKTLVAQFVARSWNENLKTLDITLPEDHTVQTVVASAAWSTFHTIGGMVQGTDGFTQVGGVFIDPETVCRPVWRLLDGALVLDELNRAEMDRCVGELYPLLSRTVRRVRPAGLPDVDAIELPERFRVVATVNDTNPEDIVFPMSHGLARRFQRIDMLGASEADIADFLETPGLDAQGDARLAAAREVLTEFFGHAEGKLLHAGEERLPFGAGWFGLLQAWVAGSWSPPEEADTGSQARMVLAASLRTALRIRALDEVLDKMTSEA